jgi:hypothetical protein
MAITIRGEKKGAVSSAKNKAHQPHFLVHACAARTWHNIANLKWKAEKSRKFPRFLWFVLWILLVLPIHDDNSFVL